jgi:hypothetical protein
MDSATSGVKPRWYGRDNTLQVNKSKDFVLLPMLKDTVTAPGSTANAGGRKIKISSGV